MPLLTCPSHSAASLMVSTNPVTCPSSSKNAASAAVLVAINSVFQIVMYTVLGYFYLTVVPGWLGGSAVALDVSMGEIARSVLIFLGIPLAAGFLTRLILTRTKSASEKCC